MLPALSVLGCGCETSRRRPEKLELGRPTVLGDVMLESPDRLLPRDRADAAHGDAIFAGRRERQLARQQVSSAVPDRCPAP